MGEKTKALLGQFEAACRAANDLEVAATGSFRPHPDADASGLRRLFNKLLGSLYHCLKTRTLYAENVAFPGIAPANLQLAA
jgi:hypothetical protein